MGCFCGVKDKSECTVTEDNMCCWKEEILHKKEEKMYPLSLIKLAFEAGRISYQCDNNEGTDWNTWFEQNVK